MYIKLVPIFVLLCLITSPVQAVTINDKGAKQIKDTLSAYLDEQKRFVRVKGGALTTEGDITVEQAKEYYAATLPAMTLQQQTGTFIKVGLTAINVIPTDKKDSWKMSMAIPTPVLITDRDDNVIGRINITKQNMGGIWSSSLGGFSKLSAQYDGINFSPTEHSKDDTVFYIDKASINSNINETKENIWNGPSNIIFSNISLQSSKDKKNLSVEEVNVNINIENYNRALYKKSYSAIEQESETGVYNGINNNLINLIKASGEGTVKISINNVNTNSSEASETSLKSIDTIEFMGESNFKEDKLNQTIDLSYNGLKLNSTAHSLIPEQFKTSISLDQLPLETIINMGKEAIAKNTENTPPQNMATSMMNSVIKKLKEARTSLTLKNTLLTNEFYNINLYGMLEADSKSPKGGSGSLNIETTGLDNIISELQKSPNGENFIQPLTMFRIISNQNGDKNTAKLELHSKGNVTINGKDIGALIGGAEETPPQ